MNGLFGAVGDLSAVEVEAIADRLRHRGKHVATWSPVPGVVLGQVARAPVAAGGSVAFDGFITHPSGSSDAELIAAIVDADSLEGLERLSGHFAAAMVGPSGQVWLVRDRFGARPLVYARVGERTVFASEYKALLALDGVAAEPDRDAIQFIHRTRHAALESTALAAATGVAPSGLVTLTGDSVEVGSWWRRSLTIVAGTPDGYAAELRSRLVTAADRQADRFARVGVSLSGGIDSAVAAAVLREARPDAVIPSFSAGFGEGDAELSGAETVARHLGTDHHEIVLRPEEIPPLVEEMVWHLEDPVGREETAFLVVTSRAAADTVDLLTSGYAADLLFAGMPRHRVLVEALRRPFVRRPLEEFYRYTQTDARPSTVLGRALVAAYFRGRRFPPPPVPGASPEPPAKSLLDPRAGQPLGSFLLDQVGDDQLESKVERLHTPYGLTFDSPFMDRDVVRWAFSIPEAAKVRGKVQKAVLRDAVRDLLPDEVVDRRKTLQKLRHDSALSDVLDHLAGVYLDTDAARTRGLVEPDYLARVRRRPGDAYPTEQAYRLWTIILVEVWCRIFIDGRGRTPVGP